MCENEIPKYRKKKIKSNKKASHKHEYKECILKEKNKDFYLLGNYCIICGKIGFTGYDSIKLEDGRSRLMSTEELLEKYKEYEIIILENIFKDKYVKWGDKIEN